ncbi:MAG: hypothetical protein ACT4P2_08425 [Pseudomonadota bacterium]
MTTESERPPDRAEETGSSVEAIVLALEALLPDTGGEIVIHSEGVGAIGIQTDYLVIASGTAEAHVTAAGENVSGYFYYRLDNGITLYCVGDTLLTLGPDVG